MFVYFPLLPLKLFQPSQHKTRRRYFITEISVCVVWRCSLCVISVLSNLTSAILWSKSGVSSSLTSSLPWTKDQLILLNLIITREKLLLLLLTVINNKNPPGSLLHLLRFIYHPFVVEKTEMSYNLTFLCIISGITARNKRIQSTISTWTYHINVFAMVDTDCGWY